MGKTRNLIALLLTLSLTALTACGRQEDVETEGEITAATEEQAVVVEEPAAPEPRELTVAPTEENVRLVSRTFEEDGVTWLAQSGSAVECEVTATHAQVQIVGDDTVENEPSLRPRFAVLVDGEVILDDTLSERERTIEVLSSEEETNAVIEVMQLSETNRGIVGVKAITLTTAAENPVVPTEAKPLSIEFIGDSITCAYGVEAASAYEPFATTTENFMKSYAYLTAQALGADYSTACYSGYGIVSGWSADGSRNESMLLPPVYDLVANEHDQPWDFAAHPHDVVVINLGTNDSTYTLMNESRMWEFCQEYASFLAHVRTCNPDAYLVCTLGTMEGGELYPYLEQAVEDFKANTGDTRVTCYRSDPIDFADGCGTGEHPNATTQQKSADKLVEVIRTVLAS